MKIIKQYWYQMLMVSLILIYLYTMHLGIHEDEMFGIVNSKMQLPWKRTSFAEYYTFFGYLAGICLVPFETLYVWLKGNMEGIVIYLRTVYIVFQLIISYALLCELRHFFSKNTAQAISLLSFVFYFNFFMPGYKAQLYWFLTLMFICLLHLKRTGKSVYAVLAAVCFSCAVVSYATSFLMIVVVFYFLLKESKKKEIILFLGTGFLCFLLLCGYILKGTDLQNIIETLFGGLQNNRDAKASFHEARNLVKLCIIFAVSNVPWILYERYLKKHFARFMFAFFYICFLLFAVCILRPQSITISRFWYVLLCVFFSCPILLKDISKIKNQDVANYFFCMSLGMLLSISAATMQGIAVIAFGCIYGLMGELIMIIERAKSERWMKLFCGTVVGMLVFCFVFFVSDANVPGNIFSKRIQVEEGTLKGIFVKEDLYREYMQIDKTIEDNVGDDDKLLVLGSFWSNHYAYMESEAEVATYDVPSPSQQKLLDYYDRFPNKIPTIILIEKNRAEFNPQFIDFLEDSYFKKEYSQIWDVYILK